MNLFQRIKQQASSLEIKLLCQIPISDSEYNELLEYTRLKVSSLYIQATPDIMLSVALVQVAIRTYVDGNYWDYFLAELGIYVSISKRNYLGQVF